MDAFLLYSLKTGACLAVFYLFFKLLLSRETFHRFNRLLVLGVLAVSFLLPLCVITVRRELPFRLPMYSAVPEPTGATSAPLREPEAAPFPWEGLAGGLFLLGAAATLAATCVSLGNVLCIVRRGRRETLPDGSVLVVTDRMVTPFSWGRYIVLSERDRAENGREIILHEQAHRRLHHSWDLLAADLAGCLQWYNPAMWLLRRELRAIHEYEADSAVLESGVDARRYQLLLIRKAAGGRWLSIANNFNHNQLKNRLTMMLRSKSSRWSRARALLFLPLAGLALGAFAQTVYVFPVRESADAPVAKADSVQWADGRDARGRISRPESNERQGSTFTASSVPSPAYDAPDATASTAVSGRDEFVAVRNAEEQVTFMPANRHIVIRGVEKKGDFDERILCIVDGRPADSAAMKDLDPAEIRTIDVTKDSATLRAYGDRYDGMIRITTKSAKPDKGVSAASGDESGFDKPQEPAMDDVVIVGFGDGKKPASMSKALHILDGKRVSADEIYRLKPGEITSMTVIKDADAGKEFGPDAVNGVVVVTTLAGGVPENIPACRKGMRRGMEFVSQAEKLEKRAAEAGDSKQAENLTAAAFKCYRQAAAAFEKAWKAAPDNRFLVEALTICCQKLLDTAPEYGEKYETYRKLSQLPEMR